MSNKQLWVNDIGLFEILPNSGQGNCLFHSIADALFENNSTFKHSNTNHLTVRESTVKYLTSDKGKELWSEFQPGLYSFWKISPEINLPSEIIQNVQASLSKESKSKEQQKEPTCSIFSKHRNSLNPFKEYYSQLMSQDGQPGSVYELQAAGSLFGFHFDYIDMHSPEDCREEFTLRIPYKKKKNDCLPGFDSGGDEGANNLNANTLTSSTRMMMMGGDGKENLVIKNIDNQVGDRQVVCQGRMYQFYSCRNNGCKVPREESPGIYPRDFDVANNFNANNFPDFSSKHLYLLHTRYSIFEGHWELLRPIKLKSFPVPLHRKVYGITCLILSSYSFSSSNLDNFEPTKDISEEIEDRVKSGEIQIPPEDLDWPADDEDNFSGCLSPSYDNLIKPAIKSNPYGKIKLWKKNFLWRKLWA